VRGSDRKGASAGKLSRKENKPAFFKRYTPDRPPNHVNFDREHRAVLDDDPRRVRFTPAQPYKHRPISTGSALTLVDNKNPSSPIKGYDFESDITSARKALEDGDWKPGFLSTRGEKRLPNQTKERLHDSDSEDES